MPPSAPAASMAGHADAAPGAHLLKQGDGAGAAAAEGEVVAHHHVARADARGHHVGDEGGRLARGEGAVETRDVEDLDAERGEVAGLEAEGREPEGFARGGQDLARVRLEGEHGKRRAEGPCDARAFLDHRAVAEMDPVEIADGDDRAARVCGRGLPVPYDAHGRAVSLIRARGRICARPRLGQRRAGGIPAYCPVSEARIESDRCVPCPTPLTQAVMAGLVPAIHGLFVQQKQGTWMPGSSPGMTETGNGATPSKTNFWSITLPGRIHASSAASYAA